VHSDHANLGANVMVAIFLANYIKFWRKNLAFSCKPMLWSFSDFIVSACHQGEWSYGSWDRIPPEVWGGSFKKVKQSVVRQFVKTFPNPFFVKIYTETCMYRGSFKNCTTFVIFTKLSIVGRQPPVGANFFRRCKLFP
jgi:hypothetical protein